MVLNALVEATTNENRGLSVGEIAGVIHDEPTKSQKVMLSKTINRLVDLGFAYVNRGLRKEFAERQNYYQATGWAVSKHRVDF